MRQKSIVTEVLRQLAGRTLQLEGLKGVNKKSKPMPVNEAERTGCEGQG